MGIRDWTVNPQPDATRRWDTRANSAFPWWALLCDPALPHHRRGLAEQDLAFLLGAVDRLAKIRIDLFRLGVGTRGRGPCLNRFQPALQMREVVDILILVLVGHDPGIARHVGDRI